ncbi:hypothetical protein [Vulcanisaeta sp. JCM 16159]|nr:hypothetical protein [Vulcanisaeta sp. JCM 16159]
MLEKVGVYRINGGIMVPDAAKLRLAIKLFDFAVIITLIIISASLILRVFFIPLFI